MLLFIRERVPIIPYSIFAGLITLAPFFLLHLPVNPLYFALSFIGVLLLFIQMRLLNDIADSAVDKIAHKNRPFARGALSLNDGERMGGFLQLGIIIFSGLILFITSYTAFFFYAASAVYIWNTYKGFFFETWMKDHPIIAFILGELVFFPIIFFCFAIVDEKNAFDQISIAYAFLLFGALLIYNITRKLDPKSHPVLQNFVHLMGYRRVFFCLIPLLFLCFMLASTLHLEWILWPVQFAAFVSLALVLFSSMRWGFAAAVALISLYVHAASPIIKVLLETVAKS